MNWKDSIFREAKRNLLEALESTSQGVISRLFTLSRVYCEAYRKGGKLLVFGNGGSAADAQHIAAELVNRFRIERRPLPAVALTTDTSILTAVGNDYDFRWIFKKQVEALCTPKDLVLGISTSGTSENVICALKKAQKIGAYAALLSGQGGRINEGGFDLVIAVESNDTPRIQEVHLFLEHLFCDLVEHMLFRREKANESR